jgi:excinuclease ABC subunit A
MTGDQRPGGALIVRGAREHNLRGFDLTLPRGRLVVITGVSGSGKSSLAFDTLFREGQRRFLETLPAFARSFAGSLARPEVTAVEGLGPAVAVGQRLSLNQPRSTVGTLSELWDLLRLLFARLGQGDPGVSPRRGLFSFNGPEGACPRCQGLGVEDRLDLDLVLADPDRSLRQGALRVSTPNGYLMYSQVTLEVLDQVLRAHGGSVDTPWRELPEEARQVVWHGSDRLRVPYGKHPLESRLKWQGITPRPRPDGFYRGLVPVMEEILRGKRNDSILRFVRSRPCAACGGTRLRPEALTVRWQGRRIVDLAAMTVAELAGFLAAVQPGREAPVLEPIRRELLARCGLMAELGLDYLTCDRPAPTLSPGEAQRLRLLTLAQGGLRGLLVVLDEPSAGLHPDDVRRLLRVLFRLRDQGQTVVVVEHDPGIARAADWLVDLGPGPGVQGGQLLWSGPPAGVLGGDGPTARWLRGQPARPPKPPRPAAGMLRLDRLARNNLHDVAVELRLGALNVVSGVSGAGKSSLLAAVAARIRESPGEPFRRLVQVDAEPIGRTPRSNAATYTGALDLIRDRFAATPEAKALGLGKGHFTCNTPGGRCEACEGAGVVELGMRHLGRVDQVCGLCGGRRFHPDVLSVRYRGLSVADLLEGSVDQAAGCFQDDPGLSRILGALRDCGLGYLTLGQPATTLSGGEAQRVKLAAELAGAAGRQPRKREGGPARAGGALILLDEPSTGLHAADVAVLLDAWDRLLDEGHTLLVVDNDLDVLRAADQVIDLGPGSGPRGGRVVLAGTPEELAACPASLTGRALAEADQAPADPLPALPAPVESAGVPPEPPMTLTGVTTHNLKGLDVAIPAQGLTVVTGPSGSGKSSLVFDTLLAEARNRFADLVAPWARRLLPRAGGAAFETAQGLRAAVAVSQSAGRRNPRSRLATAAELDELLRLLYARAGVDAGALAAGPLRAGELSANTQAGACPRCRGLGFLQSCAPERLVSHPDRSLLSGALDGTPFGAYLGEPDGQHMATLLAAGAALGLDFSRPWRELGAREREVAMAGAGDRRFAVTWHYQRGKARGTHQLEAPWAGFARLVDQEYERLHGTPKGDALAGLLAEAPCPDCAGERLNPRARAVRYLGLRLPELAQLSVDAARAWFTDGPGGDPPASVRAAAGLLYPPILERLRALAEAGLGYLALDREMASLSGGEAQRVRLAAALGGGLCGVAYLLDEPTRGLHARDGARLAGLLRGLADAGNAVVVVEHDPGIIAAADQVLRLGPGAGPGGGQLVASGAPGTLGILRAKSGPRAIPAASGAPFQPGVSLRGAHLHHLRNLDLGFPAGALVAVTGVSGSGKSTLVRGVLAASLRALLEGREPVGCAALECHLPLSAVLAMDPAAAAGGASTVASLSGLGERLRKRFAAAPEARAAHLAARHFSTAVPGGRCETCQGRGAVTVAMDLLPDVTLPCEDCQGRRFLPEVLACRYRGLSITGALDLPIQDLAAALDGDASLERPLRALAEAGLGYLNLGQEGAALSTGEAQRLALTRLLERAGAEPVAVLLDEPARGLGAGEVGQLLATLRRLAADGHLVVAVEHNLDFIAGSDWIIDLGPGGGADGGQILAEGPVAAVLASGTATGEALAARLQAIT